MKLEDLKIMAQEQRLIGVFDNIPSEVYHHPECPGISRSDLELVHKSFQHYMARKEQAFEAIEDEESGEEEGPKSTRKDNLLLGAALHDMILLPAIFEGKYVCKPSAKKNTKEGKVIHAEFEAANKGKVALPLKIWNQVHAMGLQVKAHPLVQGIMEGAKTEQTIFWYDSKTRLLCKCRPDIMREDGIIADIKSTVDASFPSFRKSIVNYSYDRQAAFYLRGASDGAGKKYNSFIFIAVEKTPPYAIAIYNVNDAVIEVGNKLCDNDLEKVLHANKQNTFGYPMEIQDIDMAPFGFCVDDR